jgi:hypothetical protein
LVSSLPGREECSGEFISTELTPLSGLFEK